MSNHLTAKKREEILQQLDLYLTEFPEEREVVAQTRDLILKEPFCLERSSWRRHITASCWIVDEKGEYVLLILHRKLQLWIGPGGHAEGDSDLIRVARKEALEETGLREMECIGGKIFFLHVYQIPAWRETPAHEHYDFAFFFVASRKERVKPNRREVEEVRWVPLEEVSSLNEGEGSQRMIERMKRFFLPLNL